MAATRIDELREALGGAHPMAATKVKDHLDEYQIGFIRHSPFAVMASADGEGNCDASPKGGEPGFAKVLDERTLLIPDIGGNRLFQSYENFQSNGKAGFVFFIPGIEVTVRVNGRVEILEAAAVEAAGGDAAVHNPDDNAGIVQGLKLTIDEAYFHCPRSMHFGEVWSTQQIETNRAKGLADLKSAG
ncbi:MAG: pyridoxamine 5'-phosphate oxidase family protein [Pseudomonadota bacterium]